jgi:shikimate dehydrogenase
MAQINSETQLCVSLAARPGTFGNRFHNYLYGELKLNFIYRSGTTQDLKSAVAGLRGLGVRGCGLSMPFKEQVLGLLDEVDPVARRIGAVNTIVNEDASGKGFLRGYNTDYSAVRDLLRERGVGPATKVALAGAGGMGRAAAYALHELGCRKVAVLARNPIAGRAVADPYGFEWREPGSVTPGEFEVLINATPIGMAPDPGDLTPFSAAVVGGGVRLVMDSVAYPTETALIRLARDTTARTVAGFEITLAQGVEQFRLYTGVVLRPDQVARAAAIAKHTLK